jgi:hypothetical protein
VLVRPLGVMTISDSPLPKGVGPVTISPRPLLAIGSEEVDCIPQGAHLNRESLSHVRDRASGCRKVHSISFQSEQMLGAQESTGSVFRLFAQTRELLLQGFHRLTVSLFPRSHIGEATHKPIGNTAFLADE